MAAAGHILGAAMPDLPSGTVTFVFSDLEGSTRLLKELGDEGYVQMLARHRRLVRETLAAHGGSEIDTQGDAFFYSFARARAAVAAAVELQRRHDEEQWPRGARVRVRLGLHTGEPVVGEEGYTGLDVVRAARIAADGRGGQILLSEATRAIVGDDLPEGVNVRELGSRTLKDIDKPEPLYELVYTADAPLPALAQPPTFDPTSISAWLNIAAEAAQAADSGDPGTAIEQRVLRSIGEKMGGLDLVELAKLDKLDKPPKSKHLKEGGVVEAKGGPPARAALSDEINRLRELHDAGALTDEQYQRAVDRTLGEA